MRMRFLAVGMLFALAFAGCSSEQVPESFPTQVPTPFTARELTRLGTQIALGEAITIDAAPLPGPIGEPPLAGTVEVTFNSAEEGPTIEEHIRPLVVELGTAQFDPPQGVFFVVHYTATNNTEGRLQALSHINDAFTLVDDLGREFRTAIHMDHGFSVAAAYALQAGEADPSKAIVRGETVTTAVAFNMEADSTGLYLRSERLDLEVSLGK